MILEDPGDCTADAVAEACGADETFTGTPSTNSDAASTRGHPDQCRCGIHAALDQVCSSGN
jgi:hypothetical protein